MQTIGLVQYLYEHDIASADELARAFGASARTVRSHVRDANALLAGFASVTFSRPGRGYRLVVSDDVEFQDWYVRTVRLAARANRSAADERVIYLLTNLLSRTDWVTIADLAAALYVSSQSVSGDLKQVEEELEPFGLILVKKPRYGIRIEGSEMSRRLCLANIVSQSLSKAPSALTEADADMVRLGRLVSGIVEQIIRGADFSISSISFQNLVVHIVVALGRIRSHALVPMDEENLAEIRGAAEYPLACMMARAVGEQVGIEIPETEVAYIAIHLAGKRSLTSMDIARDVDCAASEGGDGFVIPEHVWMLVGEMLERVWASFHFDFRDDIELRMNLARHLVPLITRLEYHLRVENPMLSDIKRRFPLAYAMAVDASSVLMERYATVISEEELGYVALAFALALERIKTEAPKKNVLLVCASGIGTTRLLKQAIARQFGDKIGEVRVCDVLHVAEQDFSKVDYVFTTVPIEGPIPVPVQEVGLFLDKGDVQSITALISRPKGASDYISRLFDPALFFAHLDVEGRDEVLRTMAGRVVEAAGVDEGLVELVLERESVSSTAFGNMIALPHPIRPVSEMTHVCVGLLDEPLLWGEKNVQVVVLVAIGSNDSAALDFFFTWAAGLLSNEQAVGRILHDRSFETFVGTFLTATQDGFD